MRVTATTVGQMQVRIIRNGCIQFGNSTTLFQTTTEVYTGTLQMNQVNCIQPGQHTRVIITLNLKVSPLFHRVEIIPSVLRFMTQTMISSHLIV